MEHESKQRVVGSIVLILLALIFLPLILDGDGDYQPDMESRIPETPTVDIMPEPIPLRPVIEADRLPTREVTQPTIEITDAPGEPEEEPVNPVEQSVATAAQEETQDVEGTLPEETGSEPALDEAALPEGWSVRLGVFSNLQNAVNLEARLLNAGYRAYTRVIPGAQGTVTGVFVGPQIDRDEANRLKVRLQEEFQLSGLVVRFEVEPI